jgi:hypothetical protein
MSTIPSTLFDSMSESSRLILLATEEGERRKGSGGGSDAEQPPDDTEREQNEPLPELPDPVEVGEDG